MSDEWKVGYAIGVLEVLLDIEAYLCGIGQQECLEESGE